jgi:adenine-specific DNA-methyltransferase
MLKNNLDYNDSVTPNTEFLHNLQTKLPEYFTKDGEFDFAKFQENLRENNVSDELTSGYRLDFIGKNYAKKQAGERPTTVIVPDTAHNNQPENAQSNNLFFTGDNLEVLRHLQASYQDAIDFIYIDICTTRLIQ